MKDVTEIVKEKAGSFVQYDESEILYEIEKMYAGRLELLPMDEAIKKYRFVREKMGKLVRVDRYAEKAIKERTGGYFIRIKRGAKIEKPVQTCLIMKRGGEQKPWNMIVVEEGARATVVTGCSGAALLSEGLHIGGTEFFVGENARLDYVMIHVWPRDIEVRPRSAAVVSKNGIFNSLYVALRPGAIIQMNPVVEAGRGAKVELLSILKGERGTVVDVGGEIHLTGRESSGLIKSRSVAYRKAKITVRSKIVGYGKSRGHVDCRGIVMEEGAEINAVPVLESRSRDTLLTHEAGVGKIEEEQLFYLETRGFSEEEATELVVRGFLSPRIPWLSRELRREIELLARVAARGS